jgi:methionyl-tRNA synthetase
MPFLAPHVGHLYTMVIADIMKRWQVLLGNEDAQLLTGTDEHGMKVLQFCTWGRITGLTSLDSTSRHSSRHGYTGVLRHELPNLRGMVS